MRRWAGLVALVALVACGGPSAETAVSTTTSTVASTSTVTPSTTAPSTTTTAAPSTTTTVAVPGSAVTLLVADDAGLRLWSEDGREEWLVANRAMLAAAPDRLGGMVYQEVETGRFHMVMDPPGSTTGTGRWEWIGGGEPRPIRRLREPGGVDEIVVSPGRGQTVRLIDTALLDGRPQLAYVRTTHRLDPIRVDIIGDIDATRTREVVIVDLTTGAESVAWSQEHSWEGGRHDTKLGAGVVVHVWFMAGDTMSIGLTDSQGAPMAMPARPAEAVDDGTPSATDPWVLPGTSWADLSPDGAVLAYAWTPALHLVGGPGTLAVVAVDRVTGTEAARSTVALAAGVVPSFVDTTDGRVLVGRMVLQRLAAPPTLRLGDRGDWVRALQFRLFPGGVQLVTDGVFGPATQAAVVEWQTSTGLDPTGVVDARTWQSLVGDGILTIRLAPLLMEPNGTIREIPAPGSGDPARELAYSYRGDESGRISLWDA
jgi:hypothetical protein